LGTNAWDAAIRSPVISRAGRMTVGPPGAVWEANSSMEGKAEVFRLPDLDRDASEQSRIAMDCASSRLSRTR